MDPKGAHRLVAVRIRACAPTQGIRAGSAAKTTFPACNHVYTGMSLGLHGRTRTGAETTSCHETDIWANGVKKKGMNYCGEDTHWQNTHTHTHTHTHRELKVRHTMNIRERREAQGMKHCGEDELQHHHQPGWVSFRCLRWAASGCVCHRFPPGCTPAAAS